ncbi:hypothetical protein ACFL1A_00630 [Patescibacteria group bacterium]
MNKDIVLATLIGFVIGLIITSSIIFGPKIISSITIPEIKISFPWLDKPNLSNDTTGDAKPKDYKNITISSPIPDTISENESLLISGTAPAGSTIVVGGFVDEDASVVAKDGKFAGKIALYEGKNDITVTAFTKNNILTQTLSIFYTPEKF